MTQEQFEVTVTKLGGKIDRLTDANIPDGHA